MSGVAMLWLTLAGCLIDRETYETRKAFLADDDGDGYSDYQGDCDDTNAAVFPGAGESCNFDDDDCDGAIDEGEDLLDSTWYADADEDGFGGGSPLATCEPPDGFVDQGGDCDDTSLDVFPGAAEACDGLDNDCDDVVDEEDEVEPLAWYPDDDGDGYGAGSPVHVCADPGGAALTDGDCDDSDAGVHPDREETCNGVDDDCNSVIDDAPAITWYLDRDEDGFGDDDATYLICSPPPGYTRDGGDCDDLDAERSPGATEVCEDGIDGDCDGAELTCGLPAGESTSADMSARFAVSGVESYVARTVASAGDLDDDGDDELLIARPGHDAFDGAIVLVPGDESLYLGDLDLDTTGVMITGAGAFGYAASAGQDVDGDGVTDLLVSAIFDDRAYVFTDGAAALRGGLDSGDADAVLIGPGTDASFGAAVSLLGDLDGDGLGELLVGDYLYGGSGAAFLYYGGAAGAVDASSADVVRLQGTIATEDAGHEAANLGDLDADGTNEFAIWDASVDSSESTHRAYVFMSSHARLSPGDPGTQSEVFTGPVEDQSFEVMAGVGDLNRDGHDDAAFGAAGTDAGNGTVYVLFGSASIVGGRSIEDAADFSLTGVSACGLGGSIGGVGDLDDDGYPELATGCPRDGTLAGGVWLFGGAAGLGGQWTVDDAWGHLSGANTESEGKGIATSLDLNGDSASDLLTSAWDPSTAQGQAWLSYGAP